MYILDFSKQYFQYVTNAGFSERTFIALWWRRIQRQIIINSGCHPAARIFYLFSQMHEPYWFLHDARIGYVHGGVCFFARSSCDIWTSTSAGWPSVFSVVIEVHMSTCQKFLWYFQRPGRLAEPGSLGLPIWSTSATVGKGFEISWGVKSLLSHFCGLGVLVCVW